MAKVCREWRVLPLELVEFLEALRANHIVQFEATYNEQLSDEFPIFPEVAFSGVDGTFQNLYVIDFIQRQPNGDSAIEVAVPRESYLGGVRYAYNNVNIEFGDVSWNDMVMRFPGAGTNIAGFESWFEKWIDVNLPHAVEGELAASTIHSAFVTTDFVFIDLGTAPVAAFIELLDLIALQGTTQMTVRGEAHLQ